MIQGRPLGVALGVSNRLAYVATRVSCLYFDRSCGTARMSPSRHLQFCEPPEVRNASSCCLKTVLEGSVRKVGNRLRINAQLINAEDGYHLWSERYDRTMDDVFAVQDDIARTVVEKLKVKLLGAQEVPVIRRPTDNLEGYNLFLKGRFSTHMRGDPGQEPLEMRFVFWLHCVQIQPASHSRSISGTRARLGNRQHTVLERHVDRAVLPFLVVANQAVLDLLGCQSRDRLQVAELSVDGVLAGFQFVHLCDQRRRVTARLDGGDQPTVAPCYAEGHVQGDEDGRCCANRNWRRTPPNRVGSSPTDRERLWSTKLGHPVEHVARKHRLDILPARSPSSQTTAEY